MATDARPGVQYPHSTPNLNNENLFRMVLSDAPEGGEQVFLVIPYIKLPGKKRAQRSRARLVKFPAGKAFVKKKDQFPNVLETFLSSMSGASRESLSSVHNFLSKNGPAIGPAYLPLRLQHVRPFSRPVLEGSRPSTPSLLNRIFPAPLFVPRMLPLFQYSPLPYPAARLSSMSIRSRASPLPIPHQSSSDNHFLSTTQHALSSGSSSSPAPQRSTSGGPIKRQDAMRGDGGGPSPTSTAAGSPKPEVLSSVGPAFMGQVFTMCDLSRQGLVGFQRMPVVQMPATWELLARPLFKMFGNDFLQWKISFLRKQLQKRPTFKFFLDKETAGRYIKRVRAFANDKSDDAPSSMVTSCNLEDAYKLFKAKPHLFEFVPDAAQVQLARELLHREKGESAARSFTGVPVFTAPNLIIGLTTPATTCTTRWFTPYFFDKRQLDKLIGQSVDGYYQELLQVRRLLRHQGTGDAGGAVPGDVVDDEADDLADPPEVAGFMEELGTGTGLGADPATAAAAAAAASSSSPSSGGLSMAGAALQDCADHVFLGKRWGRRLLGLQPKFRVKVDSFQRRAAAAEEAALAEKAATEQQAGKAATEQQAEKTVTEQQAKMARSTSSSSTPSSASSRSSPSDSTTAQHSPRGSSSDGASWPESSGSRDEGHSANEHPDSRATSGSSPLSQPGSSPSAESGRSTSAAEPGHQHQRGMSVHGRPESLSTDEDSGRLGRKDEEGGGEPWHEALRHRFEHALTRRKKGSLHETQERSRESAEGTSAAGAPASSSASSSQEETTNKATAGDGRTGGIPIEPSRSSKQQSDASPVKKEDEDEEEDEDEDPTGAGTALWKRVHPKLTMLGVAVQGPAGTLSEASIQEAMAAAAQDFDDRLRSGEPLKAGGRGPLFIADLEGTGEGANEGSETTHA
eukprot:TRINITY_DN13581_c0_g1_i1.p1 TRINITY_DN13581_c0_g1~~TRINITY_DN13581_c0_g1_i1.p1  ORF type:complete len:928 (-),score=155.05 TRINITY_DN13581_c0_g1_i1:206-2938(-)